MTKIDIAAEGETPWRIGYSGRGIVSESGRFVIVQIILGHGVSSCFGTGLAQRQYEGPAVYEFLQVQPQTTYPPETTNENAPKVGADGADLSCPGSSVVADEDA